MPLSTVYGKIVALRNLLYDRGILDTFSLGAKTISIGNITVGGTGKTPLAAYVARVLADRGETVCILTRGYGRKDESKRVLVSDRDALLADADSAGDEAFELARNLLGKAIVLADRDRVAAAEWARRKFGITAFVLDDGFQHRKARRDVDIVCIDATAPFRGGKMLPAGRLREPLEGLRRADVVVITRADLIDSVDDLKNEVSRLNARARVFTGVTEILNITELSEFLGRELLSDNNPQTRSLIDALKKAGIKSNPEKIDVAAFCGLGNPDNFYKQITTAGGSDLNIRIKRSFPDHYRYKQSDISGLEKEAKQIGTDAFVTTAKDAVKLRDIHFSLPCFVVEIGMAIDDPDEFAALL